MEMNMETEEFKALLDALVGSRDNRYREPEPVVPVKSFKERLGEFKDALSSVGFTDEEIKDAIVKAGFFNLHIRLFDG